MRNKGLQIALPGYDAGKKIKGKKRHIFIHTQGLLLHAIIHAGDIQGRGGDLRLKGTLFRMFPFLLQPFAGGGYQGPVLQAGLKRVFRAVDVSIAERSDIGLFIVLPNCWIVERTIGWLNRLSPLGQGSEVHQQQCPHIPPVAFICVMVRKLRKATL